LAARLGKTTGLRGPPMLSRMLALTAALIFSGYFPARKKDINPPMLKPMMPRCCRPVKVR